jgi:hypothetical protein
VPQQHRQSPPNINPLLQLRLSWVSIGLIILLFLFHGRAFADQSMQANARFTQGDNLAEVRQDLAKIDEKAAQGLYAEASRLVGRNISTRDIYRSYLEQADSISRQLLAIQPRLSQTLSLQQLGALTQSLSAENQRFRNAFTHGEEQFYTYQLIQTAIQNLEDACSYWRIANRYRALYRGSGQEHASDDQILRIKLQTALNAIDQLKVITHTRESLAKDLSPEQF